MRLVQRRFLCPYKANRKIQMLLKNMFCTPHQTPPVAWSTEQARKPNTKTSLSDSWQRENSNTKTGSQYSKSHRRQCNRARKVCVLWWILVLLWQEGQKLDLSLKNYELHKSHSYVWKSYLTVKRIPFFKKDLSASVTNYQMHHSKIWRIRISIDHDIS